MLSPCDPHQNKPEDELTRKAQLSCETSEFFKPDTQELTAPDQRDQSDVMTALDL